MSNCYICEQKILSDNTYNEHIILNSLGGKLKSKKVICRSCAPAFDSVDAALGKLLNPIAAQLNIERDRGIPQPFSVDVAGKVDEEYVIMPGGKPRLSRPKVDISEDLIAIEASDEKTARGILKGAKKKHPELTDDVIESLIKGAERRKESVGKVNYSIRLDNLSLLRAICKMAMSFYMLKGGDRKYIAHLIPYIKSEVKKAKKSGGDRDSDKFFTGDRYHNQSSQKS